ncbi:endolytic transglycosylase MltG [Microbacterium testaceum]|uniref:endolytic transglycosylase MltG n=1 Tax=Microbacterium testaceum TaxID=2033 RepID=UPI000CCDCF5A|nr:endolytic transglycosylase MltG [Microbacterium testaceum]PNW08666.1 endolytic transglycosylase MltG [Microbacterium testaceum]
MPENQPPENDPFADLYGRLPDPRTGARSSRRAAASGENAPPSRRAAREARRAATEATPTISPEQAAEVAPSVPAERGAEPAPAPRVADAQPPLDPAASSERPRAFPVEPADAPRSGSTPAPRSAAEQSAARAEEHAPARRADHPSSQTTRDTAAAGGRDEAAPGPRRNGASAAASTAATEPAVAGRASRAVRDQAPRTTSAQNTPSGAAAQPARDTQSAAWQAAARRADAPRSAETPHAPSSSRRTEPARDREPALVGPGAAAAASAAPGAAASGSLEELFTGETTTQQIGWAPQKPPKRRRHVGRWIALAIVLILVGGVAGGGFALWNTYGERIQAFLGNGESLDYQAGQATGEARVTIVSGDTGQSVSPKLFEAGVTKASNSLYKYMVDNAVGFTFQPGVYKLQQQMTSEAVIAALRDPANRLDNSVQLREGLTLKQSLDIISEQTGIARADLDAAVATPATYGVSAPTLEGWIFPATYDFDDGVTASQVIDRMVKRTIESLDKAGVAPNDRERILTIASIIEREARSSEDFYKVSRVIENRLQPDNTETHGLLQMDSTAQYGANELDAGASSSSANALNSDNPYNTYKYPGLPVGPIANAGDLAIDAAMHPVDGPWYYFTTVNLSTGETVFSTTYADQEKAVAQFQQWCRENPNGGC